MAQSTEDYLDSLLRQAMGIPDPEPAVKEESVPDLEREDVLAMAEGLSGSNSAILGNVYDHNASFTNEGEIEIPAQEIPNAAAQTAEILQEPVIGPDDMPDPDAPVAIEKTVPIQDEIPVTESLLPNIEESAPAAEAEPEPAPEPVMESALIPDSPVIEQSDDLDLLQTGVMDGLVEPSLEGHTLEAPVVEEPVIEKPVIEEPVIEEPVAEEVPAAEEAPVPTMSIDDLDPNDSNKALDADMIAALFAGANAEAEAAAEEPVAEEAPAEEPVIEEPVAEETPATEEAPVPTMSIDDLDPNDSNKALDADMIAALFAGANAEAEPPAEEPAAEEAPAAEEPAIEEPAIEEPAEPELTADEEAGLEELSIPDDSDADSPLEADQEISDLLSTLGEITGEGSAEEESAPEEEPAAAEEGAPEPEEAEAEEPATEEAPSEEPSLDGVDMFDTDLSAMLDEALSSVDAPEGGEAASEAADEADLNDLLGSLDDGSGDLSDIGDLLEKDENSELVDPNTETAEALFASDSEEELFDIENVIDEEEGDGKGKKKKKKGLFGRKKKKSDNVEVIGGDEEMLVDPDLLDIPDESELPEKKPGFFARLFAKLFEEVGEDAGDENELIGLEQTAVEIAQEGAAENEAILAELGEEGADKKKGKKEKKKKEKKEKKDKKGGAAEGEEGEEGAEQPKKKKKEKKKKEKLPELPGKRLPRKKVVAISLFCITIGLVITFLAFMYPYSQDMKKAKKFYSTGEYQKTYEYMRGHKLTSDDQVLYDKTTTLLRIKRPYDSYQNYMKMGLRMEALNALVQGIQMSDKYAQEAASLGINDKYSLLSRKIYDELYNTFGVTVDRARSWIELEGSPEYTRALYECLLDTSAAKNVTDDGMNAYIPQMPEMPDGNENTVINAEENDL